MAQEAQLVPGPHWSAPGAGRSRSAPGSRSWAVGPGAGSSWCRAAGTPAASPPCTRWAVWLPATTTDPAALLAFPSSQPMQCISSSSPTKCTLTYIQLQWVFGGHLLSWQAVIVKVKNKATKHILIQLWYRRKYFCVRLSELTLNSHDANILRGGIRTGGEGVDWLFTLIARLSRIWWFLKESVDKTSIFFNALYFALLCFNFTLFTFRHYTWGYTEFPLQPKSPGKLVLRCCSLTKANVTSLSHTVGLYTNINVCTSFSFATVSSPHLNSLVIGFSVGVSCWKSNKTKFPLHHRPPMPYFMLQALTLKSI